jgi:hypothetical protein
MSVAQDEHAPSLMRADAYLQLVRMAVAQEDWEVADRLLAGWIRARPGDNRASMIAPTVANRLARQRRDRED